MASQRKKKEKKPGRKKPCKFCMDHVVAIDFKDDKRLRRFMTDRGKIAARRITGTCVAVAFALGFPVQAMIPRQPWFVGLDPRSDRAVEQTIDPTGDVERAMLLPSDADVDAPPPDTGPIAFHCFCSSLNRSN